MKLPNGQLFTSQLSIGIHLDDLLIACEHQQVIDDLIKYLRQQFEEVGNVTELKTHLGLYIEYFNDNNIKLSQRGYIQKITKTRRIS